MYGANRMVAMRGMRVYDRRRNTTVLLGFLANSRSYATLRNCAGINLGSTKGGKHEI